MELLYPGYKSYFSRFRTKPFQTEYITRYCNSEAPVLYSQVPKYTWYEPRQSSVAARDEGTTKLTHLRPPFAARMTSYEPDGTYLVGKKGMSGSNVVRSQWSSPKERQIVLETSRGFFNSPRKRFVKGGIRGKS